MGCAGPDPSQGEWCSALARCGRRTRRRGRFRPARFHPGNAGRRCLSGAMRDTGDCAAREPARPPTRAARARRDYSALAPWSRSQEIRMSDRVATPPAAARGGSLA